MIGMHTMDGHDTPAAGPPGVLHGRGGVAIAVLLVLCVSAVMSFLNRHYTLDDALIYYRYIGNALSGQGLVYNPGEYVNGLTSPLYTYFSLACAFVIRDVPLSQMLLSAVLLCGAAVTVLFIRPLGTRITAGALAGALGVASMRYFYSVVGLETPLLLLLMALALALFVRGRTGAWMIVSALLLLTRGETVFLVLLLAGTHLVLRRPFPGWRLWVVPVLLLVAHYAFNLVYFGHPLPATLMAKIQQGESGLWETGRWGKHLIFLSVGYHFDRYFASNLMLLGAPLLLALCGIAAGRRDTLTRVIAIFLVLYTAFYVTLSIPNYHWYYAPYYFFTYILAGWGIDALLTHARRMPGRMVVHVVKAGTLALVAGMLVGQTVWSIRALPQAGGYGSYTEIGLWIKEHTPPEAKVAAAEIGHIGWFSERYIIDILGLVSPPNADLIGQRRFDAWLEHYTPDYMLVHDPLWKHEVSAEGLRASGTFRPAPDFHFPGYALLVRTAPANHQAAGEGNP
jgi:arabinofuranosyltransferase